MTRSAISPRLAIRTFLNTAVSARRVGGGRHATGRPQLDASPSKGVQLVSLVPATPCTRSANSLGLVA